ncbi:MAG: DUF2852 domain-containing protein [Proteobacteria bacterium]|nr:DUF2852 domain-containing protein [Pseudomonadota bacterium]
MTEMVERIDDYGRPAWIALMVVGFILFWPLGLATLAFLLWSGRMGCGGRHGMWGGTPEDRRERFERKMQRMREKFEAWSSGQYDSAPRNSSFRPTGNRAFDEYRAETLRRLEDEAREFSTFLERLRMAKDKAEFDQYMAEKRNNPAPGSSPAQ